LAFNDPGPTITQRECTTASKEARVSTAREIQDKLKVPGRRLRAAIPEVYAGYAALHGAAMGDGALPARVKELIALAIAATRECDGCVAAHARSAVRQGVTAAEVAEAMGVVILMNGGPGTVWGPRALAAFEEFAASTGPPAGGAGQDKAAGAGEVSPPGS
jgi:AhpD family alkylhydroperoxidase